MKVYIVLDCDDRNIYGVFNSLSDAKEYAINDCFDFDDDDMNELGVCHYKDKHVYMIRLEDVFVIEEHDIQ